MTRLRTPWLQYVCITSTMRSVDKDHNISRTSSNACTTLGADVAGRCRTTMWTSSSVSAHPEVYQHQRPTSLMTASNTWNWPMAWLFTSDMLGGKMWTNHKWLLMFGTVFQSVHLYSSRKPSYTYLFITVLFTVKPSIFTCHLFQT